MAVSGEKLSSCDSGKNNILSLLHSRKEKLRRERIKNCCEQLRTLLPCEEGRKNDVASVLEATVAYMSDLQAIIPQDVAFQIAKSLRNNKRFSKRQLLSKDPAPLNFSPVPRNNAVLMIEPRSKKSEISISKTKSPSFSTKADCYAGERTDITSFFVSKEIKTIEKLNIDVNF
ncbi:spermatogenesis- and oogenesis-specific basic helix-loop-helix-containing protein 2 [Hemicordylus capensis]|uniref:spermatogenesis- and oogenesis-specific basic helix-loop-helix-containing protein 2 n=1 Tax=Hemicordylus capensis TaxID=884348 RepID=UPI002303584B|nr:spermatogenesis- and oogenesis-specific basic helix-loop-helix-containing protein 2 [Hemicordylus capensis]